MCLTQIRILKLFYIFLSTLPKPLLVHYTSTLPIGKYSLFGILVPHDPALLNSFSQLCQTLVIAGSSHRKSSQTIPIHETSVIWTLQLSWILLISQDSWQST